LSEGWEPLISKQDAPLRYPVGCAACRSALPRERVSPVAHRDEIRMLRSGLLSKEEPTRFADYEYYGSRPNSDIDRFLLRRPIGAHPNDLPTGPMASVS
jgi:hypothetical protein